MNGLDAANCFCCVLLFLERKVLQMLLLESVSVGLGFFVVLVAGLLLHSLCCRRALRVRRLLKRLKLQQQWISPQDDMIRVPLGKVSCLVFVNGKSGGQQGEALLAQFRSMLHAAQVVDLSCANPEDVLRRVKSSPRDAVRLLCCGGDGTVGWILAACRRVGVDFSVGVLPLGTGNDLARAFGWGTGAALIDRTLVALYLRGLVDSKVDSLDQWTVVIYNQSSGDMVRTLTMNNYFSLGIDAAAALKFHEERLRHPERFSSQAKNVLKYALLGFEGAFDSMPLGASVTVVDETNGGSDIPINEHWKGIVVSNLPCYQGGKQFWGDTPGETRDEYFRTCVNDQRLEVMALSGSLHIGMVHLNADSALQLARVSGISFAVSEDMALQVDGEPWYQEGPFLVTIRHLGQCRLLRAPNSLI